MVVVIKSCRISQNNENYYESTRYRYIRSSGETAADSSLSVLYFAALLNQSLKLSIVFCEVSHFSILENLA